MTATLNPPDRVSELHRRHLVVDSLAGGPGVFTPYMQERIDQLASRGLATPDVFRELSRLQTSAFLAGEFHEYWAAIDTSMVDILSISIGAWGDQPFSYRGAVQDLGEWHRRFTHIDRFIHVQSSDDLTQAQQQHRTGILLGFQDCSQLEQELRNLETFHGLGIRMIQLTYNESGPAGSGCVTSRDNGLTTFGRELVRAMNDLGMIVDVSHCGSRTTLESIDQSRAPVAVSHAACRALHAHPRNKDDAVLRALRDTGGYIGVCAVPAFLAPRAKRPSVATMARHIDHALEIRGVEGVGIGSDWGVAGSPSLLTTRLRQEARRRGFREDDEFDFADHTEGFESWASGFPRITQQLFAAGHGEQTIAGVLGANFRRFYRRVEAAAG
ncbi:MAG: dipeptidase [Pseudonocardiaceae bacterium]